jgi:hypothetical protein
MSYDQDRMRLERSCSCLTVGTPVQDDLVSRCLSEARALLVACMAAAIAACIHSPHTQQLEGCNYRDRYTMQHWWRFQPSGSGNTALWSTVCIIYQMYVCRLF